MSNPFTNPDAAARYNAARQMPQETIELWLARLKLALAAFHFHPQCILDLGCGTGRFTGALADTFDCGVVAVDPSEAMLHVARQVPCERLDWRVGTAEDIPLENGQVDLVFMSQVFHHLPNPAKALREIGRVLTETGFLAIRNSTRENNAQIEWLRFFPAAQAIEDKRILSQQELSVLVCQENFQVVTRETVEQYFAASYAEYVEKIGQRGLSSLLSIPDAAFASGLLQFKHWASLQPVAAHVNEPVDLFILRKLSG